MLSNHQSSGLGARLRRPTKLHRERRAFTLMELLVAIVIIAVLVGLLVPAIMAARKRAQVVAVTTEISQLSSAIAAFKSHFGIEPPSRIGIYEAAADWNSDPESKSLIRRMWPQFDFADKDRNSDGDMTDSIVLTPSECLVLFLGGVLNNGGVPVGFSTNDTDPFLNTGNRTTPFFEFKKQQLVLATRGGFTAASYVDPISGASGSAKPYLYFSSYDGSGYVAADVTGSGIANVYLQTASGPPHNAASHQIICAGFDGDFGAGGLYDKAQPNSGLSSPADYDNITNFAGDQLKP